LLVLFAREHGSRIVYVAGWSVHSIGDHAGRPAVMLGDLLERNADGGVVVLVTPWHMAVQHVGLVPPHDSLVSY
jgi:hypothetical protein